MSFVAIVLDHRSQAQCRAKGAAVCASGDFPIAKVHCHHVTLHLGKAKPEDKAGSARCVTVTHVGGIPGRVVAFKVEGADDSKNAHPHITIATAEGAKPREAGGITDWHPIKPFEVRGAVEQCS